MNCLLLIGLLDPYWFVLMIFIKETVIALSVSLKKIIIFFNEYHKYSVIFVEFQKHLYQWIYKAYNCPLLTSILKKVTAIEAVEWNLLYRLV